MATFAIAGVTGNNAGHRRRSTIVGESYGNYDFPLKSLQDDAPSGVMIDDYLL